MSDINVPLLRKTLDWAHEEWQKKRRGEISEWNQGAWMASTVDLYYGRQAMVIEALRQGTACGTACCIAGKVALEAGWHTVVSGGLGGTLSREGEMSDAYSVGMELLGLDEEQAMALFSGSNTIWSLYAIAGAITNGEIALPPELSHAVTDI